MSLEVTAGIQRGDDETERRHGNIKDHHHQMIDSSCERVEGVLSWTHLGISAKKLKGMQRKLKVAHLSDMPTGGAAVAANRLVRGLAASNEVCLERWVFGKAEVPDLPVEQIALEKSCPKTFLERVVRVFSRKGAKALQNIRQRKALLTAIATRKPDILHLHNLHASSLRHRDLLALPRNVRIAWTMHDEWPFAPWAYHWLGPDGRERFQGKESPNVQLDRAQFFRERPDVVLISPSRWLADQAHTLCRTGVRVEVIPNGIETEIFSPHPKTESRARLGLDPERAWLGLAAASFDQRKGAHVFKKALTGINKHSIGLAIWGPPDQSTWPDGIRVKQFGFVCRDQELVTLYSAVDLFVCPSLIDNLPNTILESMACGTPVVASNAGGIPDMVHRGETGWLYNDNSSQACANALQDALISKEQWSRYAGNCRALITGDFSLEKQTASYLELYRNMRLPL